MMRWCRRLCACVLFGWCVGVMASLPVTAQTASEQMSEYLMFSDFQAGIISPQQIEPDIFEKLVFIDTRQGEAFAQNTIPGAIHIEWREVLERQDEIPTDRKVVLFCNTGVLSAQAMFALRVNGFENVLVLQSGFDGWLKHHNSNSE